MYQNVSRYKGKKVKLFHVNSIFCYNSVKSVVANLLILTILTFGQNLILALLYFQKHMALILINNYDFWTKFNFGTSLLLETDDTASYVNS